MRDLLNRSAAAAVRYLEGLDARDVLPSAEAVAGMERFREPLPEGPCDPREVVDLLSCVGSPASVATAGRRFFGYVHGGCLPASLAANWLATAWDQNTALASTSPAGSLLEEVSLAWLLDVLQLPEDVAGAFVTGDTMANFTALAAARHAVLERAGWDVEADGLNGAPRVTVVISDEAHPSVTKALGLLGMGRRNVLRVPADRQGRMRSDALPDFEAPAIVCMQAGNVNTGAVDPAREICAAAHARGAWVHVDGAFGLWAAASPRYAHLVEGVAGADSWATDAHKWLNVPYDCGVALVRDAASLTSAMALRASYIPHGSRREPSLFTPELSRRARGVEVWAALRSLGRAGLADLVERTCRYAQRFAKGLQAAGYEILNDVVLNQVLVSFGAAERTREVISRIQQEGVCWCGETEWQGRVAMRISVCSWATTEEDVERSLDSMLRAARG